MRRSLIIAGTAIGATIAAYIAYKYLINYFFPATSDPSSPSEETISQEEAQSEEKISELDPNSDDEISDQLINLPSAYSSCAIEPPDMMPAYQDKIQKFNSNVISHGHHLISMPKDKAKQQVQTWIEEVNLAEQSTTADSASIHSEDRSEIDLDEFGRTNVVTMQKRNNDRIFYNLFALYVESSAKNK